MTAITVWVRLLALCVHALAIMQITDLVQIYVYKYTNLISIETMLYYHWYCTFNIVANLKRFFVGTH